ncbi:hypothetical protein NZD88_01610 [Chryseobacterium antibioticum]|uniref:Uncharacterized protein n=1 Tax=Chryseobacterium pyrolae TaxID=2987481 RepID=A0ABT2IC91_9FLAO|nr:hypothetical protein [Chryseobacterium pyrolae]MCT2406250.1 hypothetical protein [Chryseobacterium pyrolae]
MKEASSMLLLLCSFYNTNAQLYIGTGDSLNIKDSILFQTERKNNPVLLYVKGTTTVHNLEQISNIKVVVLSSPTLKKPSQTSFAKTIKKPENRKPENQVLKLGSKQEVYLSENENSVIVSYEKSGNIGIIITNTFKEKQGVLQNKYKMFPVCENKVFPKQSLKAGLFETTFLMGIKIRPPPSFKYTI